MSRFRPRWMVGDCRAGQQEGHLPWHGYAATMFFGGSACFRASWVVEIPPAPWGRRERAAAGGGPRVGG